MDAAPQLLAGKLDATHWSIRSMAGVTGFSHTTIRRIWAAFGLQPHRSETFKLSTDPLFVDKVRDIVGLYLSPPNRALVLSVDEKSQIHALDREQPVLPMMPGVPERQTHSYVRHGTTSLFAALDIASGFIIGKCFKRHRTVRRRCSPPSTRAPASSSQSASNRPCRHQARGCGLRHHPPETPEDRRPRHHERPPREARVRFRLPGT